MGAGAGERTSVDNRETVRSEPFFTGANFLEERYASDAATRHLAEAVGHAGSQGLVLFVSEVLSNDQKKRLDQILLQTAGLLCVTRPRVAKELKLSEEQKKRAAQMQQEARDEVEDLIHVTSDKQKDAKARELRETSDKRLMELLTDDQEAKWKELTGAPFRGEIRFAAANSTTTK